MIYYYPDSHHFSKLVWIPGKITVFCVYVWVTSLLLLSNFFGIHRHFQTVVRHGILIPSSRHHVEVSCLLLPIHVGLRKKLECQITIFGFGSNCQIFLCMQWKWMICSIVVCTWIFSFSWQHVCISLGIVLLSTYVNDTVIYIPLLRTTKLPTYVHCTYSTSDLFHLA